MLKIKEKAAEAFRENQASIMASRVVKMKELLALLGIKPDTDPKSDRLVIEEVTFTLCGDPRAGYLGVVTICSKCGKEKITNYITGFERLGAALADPDHGYCGMNTGDKLIELIQEVAQEAVQQ